MERTGALSQREMTEQFLDSMDLERERGITIKQHSVRLDYRAKDGQDYVLNLIDTPGPRRLRLRGLALARRVPGGAPRGGREPGRRGPDARERASRARTRGSRSSRSSTRSTCPGPSPSAPRSRSSTSSGSTPRAPSWPRPRWVWGSTRSSRRSSRGSRHPKGDPDGPFRGLVFDSWFDQYRGVVVLVHVVDGRLEPGMKVRLMASGGSHEVEQLGVFTPKPVPVDSLSAGEVGFVIAGIKRVADVAIGDTLIDERRPAKEPLPGFKEIKPMVFAGLYPVDADQYAELRDALDKLRLNDSSFFYEPETSAALGFGFRCGFLGLLHMEIVQERLEREFDLELLITAPSVRYRVCSDRRPDDRDRLAGPPARPRPDRLDRGAGHHRHDPHRRRVRGRRSSSCARTSAGSRRASTTSRPTRVMIQYELPLAEILLDFYDKLKSASRGYASLDYEFTGTAVSPLVKLDVLVNGDPVDALSRASSTRTTPYHARQGARREDAQADPAADVRGGDPGRDRLARHRPRDGQAAAQERASPSATAATSRASASCSRSRRKARSG